MKKADLMKKATFLLAGVFLLGSLAGCGSSASNDSMKKALQVNSEPAMAVERSYESGGWSEMADTEAYAEEYEMKADAGSGSTVGQMSENASNSKRKLIKNVWMDVETQEYEALMASVESRVKELGGYIQNMESYNGSNYSGRTTRTANMTIRIPQARLDEFVGTVSDMANVIRRTENVNDVTLTYVDMKSHKESLEVEQKRLLELLERAEILEDIITLENRLTNVRYQIESMESQLRTYDDQVDYSTVYLNMQEVKVYTPVEEKEETAWERMVNGFKDSLSDIKDGFVEFGVWFVVHIPYLVIWAVVITVAVLIIRKFIKRKKTDKKGKKVTENPSAQAAPEKDKTEQ